MHNNSAQRRSDAGAPAALGLGSRTEILDQRTKSSCVLHTLPVSRLQRPNYQPFEQQSLTLVSVPHSNLRRLRSKQNQYSAPWGITALCGGAACQQQANPRCFVIDAVKARRCVPSMGRTNMCFTSGRRAKTYRALDCRSPNSQRNPLKQSVLYSTRDQLRAGVPHDVYNGLQGVVTS